MSDLREHHYQALDSLATGPDCIGVIDNEGKLAAALVFEDLRSRGLVMFVTSYKGIFYHITPAGRAARKLSRKEASSCD